MSAPLPSERIQEIRNRAEKATGGKWWWHASADGHLESLVATRISPHRLVMWVDDDGWLDLAADDRAFIAHSRQDIPDLLAEVSRLASEVERLRKQGPCHVELAAAIVRALYPVHLKSGTGRDDEVLAEADDIVDKILTGGASTPAQTSPAPSERIKQQALEMAREIRLRSVSSMSPDRKIPFQRGELETYLEEQLISLSEGGAASASQPAVDEYEQKRSER